MASSDKPAAICTTEGQHLVDFITRIMNGNHQGMEKTYDEWAATYDQDHKSYRGPSIISSELTQLTSNRKEISILDCGSGTGLIGEGLKENGFTNITAVDISQESLNIAEKKGVYKKVVRVDVGNSKLPFEDNEFDALVASGCIVPTHISPAAFYDWVRILKPGGVIIFSIRHCYMEITKGHESLYSKAFAEEVAEVLEDLRGTKKIEMIFKKDCPQYLEDWSTILYAAKVL